MTLWYIYPTFKHVSFSVIAQEHITQLRNFFWVESLDENIIPILDFSTRPFVVLHPYFYPLQRFETYIKNYKDKIDGLVGVDVADSNRITPYAVSLTDYADALVVPSNYAKNSYVRSGVRKPVYVVPHGVHDYWITTAKQEPIVFPKLDLVKRKGYKLLLSYIMHSEYRKGYDLLNKIYTQVRKEIENVRLVIKTSNGTFLADKNVEDRTSLIPNPWLTEIEEMVLFDACDIYLLTSRGGGFEHPPLKAISRGLPVVAPKGGAWEDYLPSWSLVESKPSGVVLDGNAIHNGTGVEIDVERATDKVFKIIDDLEKYKEKAEVYANSYIRGYFTWNAIGQKLANIVEEVYENARKQRVVLKS